MRGSDPRDDDEHALERRDALEDDEQAIRDEADRIAGHAGAGLVGPRALELARRWITGR